MNQPEWIFIAIGCVAAFFTGALDPIFAVIQTKVVTIFQECDKDVQKQQILLYTFFYIAFGLVSLFVFSVQVCI